MAIAQASAQTRVNHPLDGVRLKIKRAKEHIDNLSGAAVAFRETNSYRVIGYDDPESGDAVFRLRIERDIPPEWATIIGDAIQNTRSALDHLACALVSIHSGEAAVTRFTCFPISHEAQELKAATSPPVKGMRQDAVDVIRSFNPYKGGNDTLWAIKTLNDRDKHRLLLVVGAAHVGITYDFGKKLGALIGRAVSLPLTIWPKATGPDAMEFPVKDGTVVFRIMKAARHTDEDHNPQFTFDVAFAELEVAYREPVFPTLLGYVNYVESVVLPKFSKFF